MALQFQGIEKKRKKKEEEEEEGSSRLKLVGSIIIIKLLVSYSTQKP